MRPPHGGTTGSAISSAPPATNRLAVPLQVVDPERKPHRPRDAPAGLDPVDVLRLPLVEELERRAAGFEQDHATVVAAPVGQLLEAERVAVEGDRLVEVRDGEHDAQLHGV